MMPIGDSHKDANFTIGADPEMFAVDAISKKFISGHDLLPGTKYNPFPVSGGAVQVDGVALEFNVNPTDDPDTFLKNIRQTIRAMNFLVKSKNKNINIVAQPTAIFSREYFDSLPDIAKELGCSPDFSAYTEKEQEKPTTTEPFRTGGGHIHVGWTEGEDEFEPRHFHDCIKMTRQLDAALFVPSMLWDNDKKRRTLYGKIGSFRPKNYGVEYRPLSNAWLTDPELQEFVFLATKSAAEALDSDYHLYMEKPIKHAIDRLVAQPEYTLSSKEMQAYLDCLQDRDFPTLPEEYYTVNEMTSPYGG